MLTGLSPELRGAFALCAMIAAAGFWFAVLYGTTAVRLRYYARRRRRDQAAIAGLAEGVSRRDAAIAGLKNDLLAGAARIAEAHAARQAEIDRLTIVCGQLETELRRVDGVRKLSDEGCLAKHLELEAAQQELVQLRAMLARLA